MGFIKIMRPYNVLDSDFRDYIHIQLLVPFLLSLSNQIAFLCLLLRFSVLSISFLFASKGSSMVINAYVAFKNLAVQNIFI